MHEGHLFKVLCVFFLDHIYDIVDRNHAYQPLFVIDDRNTQKVVFPGKIRHILLILERGHKDELLVIIHQIAHQRIRFCKQKPVQRQRADQMPGIINAVGRIYGFIVDAAGADPVNRLRGRQAVVQLHHLNGHNAAGRIVGILQKAVNQLARFRVGIRKHAGNDVCGNLLQEIDRVVKEQVVQQAGQLVIRNRPHDVGLTVGVKVGEYIRRDILWKNPESDRHALI